MPMGLSISKIMGGVIVLQILFFKMFVFSFSNFFIKKEIYMYYCNNFPLVILFAYSIVYAERICDRNEQVLYIYQKSTCTVLRNCYISKCKKGFI